MEPMSLKYIEKEQKFQLIGLRRYLRDKKEKKIPLTSKKRLNSLGINSEKQISRYHSLTA